MWKYDNIEYRWKYDNIGYRWKYDNIGHWNILGGMCCKADYYLSTEHIAGTLSVSGILPECYFYLSAREVKNVCRSSRHLFQFCYIIQALGPNKHVNIHSI